MKLDAVGRLVLRQARSVPILEDIKPYLEQEQPTSCRKARCGSAARLDLLAGAG